MKRIIVYFSLLAVLFALTQCAKSEPQTAESDTVGKIHISFTNVEKMKSEIQDAIGVLKFRWELNDKVHAYDGTQYLGSLTLRAEDAGNELGTFEGEIEVPSGSSIRFFYFGSEVSAPESTSTTVDFLNQEGNLDWIEDRLIASCDVAYSSGQTLFSGKFNVAFAIGKFKFESTDFNIGDKIHIIGPSQSVTISSAGEITYGAPAGDDSSVLNYNPSAPHYLVMPSSTGFDKVSFFNNNYTKSKSFSKQIVNNIFYRTAEGGPILVALDIVDLPGRFSVSPDRAITFSQGNLQATFNGSNYTWGFAERQYDFIGNAPGNTTIGNQSNGNVVDLFGWSTAQTNFGISASTNAGDYSGDFKEWGQTIDNTGTWTTLTADEWRYLFNIEPYHTDVRSSKTKDQVTICGIINCLVIAPDGFTGTIESSYDASSWIEAERSGLVCLPATYYRDGSTMYEFDRGLYWSSSSSDSSNAYYVDIDNGTYGCTTHSRYYGCAVRLVKDAVTP